MARITKSIRPSVVEDRKTREIKWHREESPEISPWDVGLANARKELQKNLWYFHFSLGVAPQGDSALPAPEKNQLSGGTEMWQALAQWVLPPWLEKNCPGVPCPTHLHWMADDSRDEQ